MTVTALECYLPVHEGKSGNQHHTLTQIRQIERRPRINPPSALGGETPERLRKNGLAKLEMTGDEVS